MKKAILALLLLSSCFSKSLTGNHVINYDISLSGHSDNLYSDSVIVAKFLIEKTGISFQLNNVSSSPLILNWDKAAISILNKSSRLIHNGIKYIDANSRAMPSATILPHSYISDKAVPADNVHFVHSYIYPSLSDWVEDNLLPEDRNKAIIYFGVQDVKDIIGQKINLYLPIEKEDKEIGYTFSFVINAATETTLYKKTNVDKKQTDPVY